MSKIRIGTRGSPLALAQANMTKANLQRAHQVAPDDIEIVVITTTGDRVRDRPLSEIGGKGLFTKEIEEALMEQTIDIAVHSMKDMPAELPDGLAFAATLQREDPRDAFVSLSTTSFASLRQGAVLGSSSIRRTAQALRLRPDLKSVQFRGNVETRLRKLSDGVADATFLAVAGLNRLGLSHHISAYMPVEQMLPAIAQGAIAIEINQRNKRAVALATALNHEPTWIAVSCERAFLKTLDGSCRTPIAGHATLAGNEVSFRGETYSPDGRVTFSAMRNGSVADATRMGVEAAEEIKAKGGAFIAA